MDAESWLCGVCSLARASCFCQCQGRECFLCETCFPIHYAKNPRLVHIAIPIAAYRQHRIPGYLDRFQARSMNVSIGKTELLKNIEEVDKCIAEVSSEIQQVINAVWEYGNSIIAELQQVKAELERDIHAAIAEVESTMHEDNPFLESSWAVSLRKFSTDSPESLKLFKYRVDLHSVSNHLSSLCAFSGFKPELTSNLIPAIYRNNLTVYNWQKRTKSAYNISVLFTDRTRICLLGREKALCVGGSPDTANAYVLDLKTGEIVQILSMIVARCAPGLIQYSNFAYVFGGVGLKSCEKFSISSQIWSRIDNMHYERCCFWPCVIGSDIYLCSEKRSVEVMNCPLETFTVLSISLDRLAGSSISIAVEGEIVILTCAGEEGRWRPGAKSVSKAKFKNRGELPNSQCSPVVIGREVVFVRGETGNLNSFDLETKMLSKL